MVFRRSQETIGPSTHLVVCTVVRQIALCSSISGALLPHNAHSSPKEWVGNNLEAPMHVMRMVVKHGRYHSPPLSIFSAHRATLIYYYDIIYFMYIKCLRCGYTFGRKMKGCFSASAGVHRFSGFRLKHRSRRSTK
jgi:GT2 family glycosyltransferase